MHMIAVLESDAARTSCDSVLAEGRSQNDDDPGVRESNISHRVVACSLRKEASLLLRIHEKVSVASRCTEREALHSASLG